MDSTPSPYGGGFKRTKKFLFKAKGRKSEDENTLIKRLKNKYESIDTTKIKKFVDLPLSAKTLSGLEKAGYKKATEIQRESIGLALRGLDILGAAKTGSGKTLAFIIPVLEKLYTNLWSQEDGLGALIITPTRELAYQIFETLREVGKRHDFSAALIIGGKDLKFERRRMDQVNIIICTPGRLLQHMDENFDFNCTNLQILVLDEADRCLDMGFEKSMNAILANLPLERQTLLFSATQTKSVKDLARLSLKSPVYVSVHENAKFSTPEGLQQSYIVCPLESKLDMLWSFLKHHKRSKILVFLSSCKQVRYAHLLFCRMKPGISLLALYGSLHQRKRMAVYEDFCKKQSAVLFATDIAARGLDFPEVDWVLQLDCPEDATTYIHRAGRTARFNKDGEALLVLLPSEEPSMIEKLNKMKIPIEKIDVNQKQMMTVRRKFESLLARDVNLKECAQRAFKAYLKYVFLMKDKSIFDVSKLDLPSFASSLGLAVAPRVRFIQKRMGETQKNASGEQDSADSEDDKDTTLIRELTSNNSTATYDFAVDDEDGDSDDLFISKKPANIDEDDEHDPETFALPSAEEKPKVSKKSKTKAQIAKKLLKKNIKTNKKVVFDEEGQAVADIRRDRQSDLAKEYEKEDGSGINIEKAKEILKLEDEYDKKIFRERIKARHREERRKAKLARKGMTKEDMEADSEEKDKFAPVAKLGNPNDNSDDDNESDYEPDLSWLPDPDKLYGPAEDGSNSGDDTDTYIPVQRAPSKKKLKKSQTKKRQMEDNDGSNDVDSNKSEPVLNNNSKEKKNKKLKILDKLDSSMMEELALQLLKK